MSQDTINEIQFSAHHPLKDPWNLWKIIGARQETVEHVLEMLKVKASPNVLVLDAGSGHGAWSKLLSDKGYSVVGADVSSFHMKNSKKKYGAVSFLISDLLHAPFIQETFNVTFCSHFLHHFQNLGEVMAEFNRVVKEEGEILVYEPNGANLVYRFTEMGKHILPRKIMQGIGVDSTNETIHQYNAYVATLLAFGFKNVRTRFVNDDAQEAKFDSALAKTFLHTYGISVGITMLARFLLFKLVARIPNESLGCGNLIIHATKNSY